jgi:prepilin-type N-terminal cleavage/methylation domain-containing protein
LQIGGRRNLQSSISNLKSAFTLIEVLVSLAILVTAMTIVWSTFSGTLSAWRRGSAMLDDLRHGDFVMEQLVSALRSAAFFHSSPGKYGFWLDSGHGQYDNDKISWVTSSSAFIPPDSPLANSLHRIVFGIDQNRDGDYAVAIRAWPHLADMEEDDVKPWFISSEVKGIRCRVYNTEDESWGNDWEDTNSIPTLVEITLFMDPIKEYGEPVKLQRLVEIPIAPSLTNAVKATEEQQKKDGTAADGTAEGGGGGGKATIGEQESGE